ncbi:MAG: GntR family transcriptional regulator, partial [Acidobacteriia bacterium]|nr:GntR family transcriptional regulator [Terriglobia bacterium]
MVRKDKVYDQVARKLEQFILQELKPGDKLPSERELA